MLASMRHNRRWRSGIIAALVIFAAIGLLDALGRLQGVEHVLVGARYSLRGSRPPAPQVLLLTVEEASAAADEPALPWSRVSMAELIRALDRAGAAVIGLDLPILAGDLLPTGSAEEHRELAAAIRAHGRVVLPMIIRERPSTGGGGIEQLAPYALGKGEIRRPSSLLPGAIALPGAEIAKAAAGIGATNIYPDLDGVVREAPLAVSWAGTRYPSFWLELVRVFDGEPPGSATASPGRVQVGDREFLTNENFEIYINYVGGYREFPRLSCAAALEMPPEALQQAVSGRIIVIGTDLAGVTPLLGAPTAPQMPGVEVAATVTENLAGNNLFRRPPWSITMLLTLAFTVLVGRVVAGSSPLHGLLATLTLLLLIAVVGLALFMVGVYLPLAPPLLSVGLTGALLAANSAAASDRQRAEAEARLQSRLQTIAGIGRLVNSTLDREQLLVEILRWAESEINAEASSILTMDPDGRHLRFEVALGDKAEMLKDISVRVGEGIAGTAAATGEPIIAQDVRQDRRWSPDVAYAIDYETRSILCVPMMLRNKVVGAIEVINKIGGPFTEYDVQLMQVIANQSALFLENARLYGVLSERVDLANDELRRANERLQFEMARIATLVDEMADAVVATDAADLVVIFNNAAERMFGIRDRKATGQPVVTLFDQPEIIDLFSMPLSPHGGSYETEITLDDSGGRVLRAHIALVDQPNARTIGKCAVFTDISHLKQLDRMKTDLISFVSHELNNPIASLQAACRVLHDRLAPDDERSGKLLEVATKQSRRMQYLVQDFLDLSRIEAGQELALQWTEIAEPENLIAGAISLCRRMDEDHVVGVAVDESAPPLWADRNKLEAVIINLVENAVKYSPDGGRVDVNLYREGDEIIIAVADEGIGIREEDLPRLFRSFQRVHDRSHGQVSGTGVGRYICMHIMQAHGGNVTVESTWGEGSTFRLHLPIRSGPPEREPRAGSGQ